jgi:hypothetical protein
MIVWSYGGGVQSAAIGVLIATGRLPKPDLAVIADTGREARSTWDYLENVMQPFLRAWCNLEIQRAPHTLATVDLYGHNGDLLIPAFTGTGGKLPTFCSNEWKRRVVARWLRQQGVEECDLWLGISADELQRARTGADPQWMRNVYPLLTLVQPAMARADCVVLLLHHALPLPEKSACWMCPLRSNEEWRALRDKYPVDFWAAENLEQAIRAKDPDVFLHRSGVPLKDVDLEEPVDGQVSLFCDGGFCWT